MALMLIKQILDSQNNESKLSANIVVDPVSGKNIVAYFNEALNLLKDGTTDGSGSLSADYNNMSKIAASLASLKVTLNDFLTGEDNEGDIDRLSELVKAIQANKDSIDALVMDNLSVDDIVNLEASVNAKIDALHTHDNQTVLNNINQTADGDLEYNGKVLNGATSVAVVSDSEAAPVFNEKLILVVTPFTGTSSEDAGE